MGVGKVPGESEGSCNWAWKADVTTLWAAPSSHHHTENISGEMCRYLPQNAQRKGRAGKKSSEIHCTQKEHSGTEMIDLSESAVKLLKPKTTQHMISDGDCWPALSPAKPLIEFMWSNVHKYFLLHVKVTCLLMIKNNSNNSTEVCQTNLTAVHQQLKVDFVV